MAALATTHANPPHEVIFVAGVELQVRGGSEDGRVRDGRDVRHRLCLLREEGFRRSLLGHVRKGKYFMNLILDISCLIFQICMINKLEG